MVRPGARGGTWKPDGRGSFQSVKLQRPDRATVCSHSGKDATASMKPILYTFLSLKWSKSNVTSTQRSHDLILCRAAIKAVSGQGFKFADASLGPQLNLRFTPEK